MRRLQEASLTTRDRAAVEEAARTLRSHFSVDAVIVFGSKVRGDDDPESDIDLLILTPGAPSREQRHAMRKALYPVEGRHEVALGLLVISSEEWHRGLTSVLPIHREVEEQGAVVA